jgi:crossover junction endodeoxyribonuclease RuvC
MLSSGKPKIILGIDPGTNILGYGIICVEERNVRIITFDVVRIKQKTDHFNKLQDVWKCVKKIIRDYKPHEMAIEAPFFGKNVQSMLKLGRAQGVAITLALNEGLPVFEYSPRKVKQSITGNGNASKEQVASMLSQLLSFSTENITLDATDALAVAVCHHFQNGKITSAGAKYSGWKQFVVEHPEKLI